MALHASDITGLVAATLDKFRKDVLTDLTTDIQEFVALGSLMQKNRMAWTGGEQYSFILQTDTSGSARATGLFDDDNIVARDHLKTVRIPIRHFTTNTSWDAREKVFNQGDQRIVDHIKARYRTALTDIHKLMENYWWGKPATSSDEDSLWGIDLPVTYPTSFSASGFVGVNPAGFSSGYGGVSSSDVPRWANYYDQYAAKTYDDLGLKWIKAAILCGFKPAVPMMTDRSAPRYGYYTNIEVMLELYRLVRSQNDNWENNIDAGAGDSPLFRRIPVQHVPQLNPAGSGETDSRSALSAYGPIYGLDWKHIKICFFENEWLAQTVRPDANKHRVTNAHWDLSANVICFDRRPQFLITHQDLC